MKPRNVRRVQRAAPAQTQKPLQMRVLLLTILCVAMVAAGFFYAARQHFATMEFGLKNSKLRKQVEDLESERRRLVLAKEVSLSPSQITRAAVKIGLREHFAAPPTSVDTRIEKEATQGAPTAELTSLRSQDSQVAHVRTSSDAKKLVKPIVQQAAVRPTSTSERPRIAESDKRVALATDSKLFTKLK
jgi:hypothetical protein